MNMDIEYLKLEENKEEIISLYNAGWGRVQLGRKFGVRDSFIRAFLESLIIRGYLDTNIVKEHRYQAGHDSEPDYE